MLLLLVSLFPTFLYLPPIRTFITIHIFVFGKKKSRNELHKQSLHPSFQCFCETMLCCSLRNCRQIREDTSILRSNAKTNNKNDGKLTNTLPLERYLLTSVLKYKSKQAVKYECTFKIYDRFKNGRAAFCRIWHYICQQKTEGSFHGKKKKEWKQNGKPVIAGFLTSLKVFFLDIRKSKWICIQHTVHTYRESRAQGKLWKLMP